MKNKELCKWLRDNSSGVYRPAAEAATVIEQQSMELLNIANAVKSLNDSPKSLLYQLETWADNHLKNIDNQ